MATLELSSTRHANQGETHVELRRVLARYLSGITVDAVLRRVYDDEDMDPDSMTREDLERIFQNSLFLSVRLFCAPERLADAMIDLAELLERIPSEP